MFLRVFLNNIKLLILVAKIKQNKIQYNSMKKFNLKWRMNNDIKLLFFWANKKIPRFFFQILLLSNTQTCVSPLFRILDTIFNKLQLDNSENFSNININTSINS